MNIVLLENQESRLLRHSSFRLRLLIALVTQNNHLLTGETSRLSEIRKFTITSRLNTRVGDQLFDDEHYSDNPQDYLPDPELKRDPAFQAAMYSAISAIVLLILNSLFHEVSQIASPLMLLAIFYRPPVTLLLLCALAWLAVYGCWLVSILCVFASFVVRTRRYPLAIMALFVDVAIGVTLFR